MQSRACERVAAALCPAYIVARLHRRCANIIMQTGVAASEFVVAEVAASCANRVDIYVARMGFCFSFCQPLRIWFCGTPRERLHVSKSLCLCVDG